MKVEDARLVRPEPKKTPEIWRWSPHKEGITDIGASYSWEPGDMTLYKMTVMRRGYDFNVLVLIKELSVIMSLREPLTRSLFELRFNDLPHLNSLPLIYQYMRALNYTDNIPLAWKDFSEIIEKLRASHYQAFWPIDRKETHG